MTKCRLYRIIIIRVKAKIEGYENFNESRRILQLFITFIKASIDYELEVVNFMLKKIFKDNS